MKTIYTKENFMHINLSYPTKVFSVFFDNMQFNLHLESEADYINIPIYKYSYITFAKQFAKYISISNQRKLTEQTSTYYEEFGYKKYKDITFAEVISGQPENLIFLFTEDNNYLDQFEQVAFNNLKPNTKLILLKDDYLQYGSNFLFRNNGQVLLESMQSFISEKSRGFSEQNITIIGSRSAGMAARIYANIFPSYKLVTFNTEYNVFNNEEAQYAINLNGIKFASGVEITSYDYQALNAKQLEQPQIMVNTSQYSFEESMKLTLFYAQINNNPKQIISLPPFYLQFIDEACKLPRDIESKPLFAVIKYHNIIQKLPVYSYGGEHYLKAVELLKIVGSRSLEVITENSIYQFNLKEHIDD